MTNVYYKEVTTKHIQTFFPICIIVGNSNYGIQYNLVPQINTKCIAPLPEPLNINRYDILKQEEYFCSVS